MGGEAGRPQPRWVVASPRSDSKRIRGQGCWEGGLDAFWGNSGRIRVGFAFGIGFGGAADAGGGEEHGDEEGKPAGWFCGWIPA